MKPRQKYVPIGGMVLLLPRHKEHILRLVERRGISVNQQMRDIIEHSMHCTCFDGKTPTSEHPPQEEKAA